MNIKHHESKDEQFNQINSCNLGNQHYYSLF